MGRVSKKFVMRIGEGQLHVCLYLTSSKRLKSVLLAKRGSGFSLSQRLYAAVNAFVGQVYTTDLRKCIAATARFVAEAQ